MNKAILVIAAMAFAACSTDRCKKGTVLINVTLSNGAESANALDVTLQVDGGPAQTQSVAHTPGSASGAIEVDFASYPTGHSLDFTLTARNGDQVLASHDGAVVAGAGCTALAIALDGAAPLPDMAGDDAQSGAGDMAGPADLTPPPPLCQTVTVSTLAGNGTSGFVDGTGGAMGTTEFTAPYGLGVDGATGIVYVADTNGNRLRKVLPDGTTTTLAGNGTGGFVDGTGGPTGTTQLQNPNSVLVVGATVYVTDAVSVRKVAADGTTTTLAGNGTSGFVDGTGGRTGTTEFDVCYGIGAGRYSNLFVVDFGNQRIRSVEMANGATTTLTGNGTAGFFDGTGGPTGTTEFNFPAGLAVDSGYNLYVADAHSNRIRKVAADGTTTTLAGNGFGGAVDGTGGASGTTEFNNPRGVGVDANGYVYVGDTTNQKIRRVAPDGTTTTLAGTGTAGFADGSGCTAQFNAPLGIAVYGNTIYLADPGNNRIRKIQLP